MQHKILVLSSILLTVAMFSQAEAQTKCIWIVGSQDGVPIQKIGVSLSLVKLLGSSDGEFDMNVVTEKKHWKN